MCAFLLLYVLTGYSRKLSRLCHIFFLNFFFCPKNSICQIMFLFHFKIHWPILSHFAFNLSHTLSSVLSSLYLFTFPAIIFLSYSLRTKKAIIFFLMKAFLNNHARKISCNKDFLYPVYISTHSSTLRFERMSETKPIKLLLQGRVLKLFIFLQYFHCLWNQTYFYQKKNF